MAKRRLPFEATAVSVSLRAPRPRANTQTLLSFNILSLLVFARIAPRRHWDPARKQWVHLTAREAATHHDAFHAFLVGNAAYLDEVHSFCQFHSSTGLPASDHDSAVYLLHTCAVQATPLHLMHAVSLYGLHEPTGRVPGSPISQPGSMVWRFDPAIVPLDDVLRDFYVLPCSRSSAMPAEPKLERPFTLFFDRAFKLYSSFIGSNSQNSQNSQNPLELKRTPSLPLITDDPGTATFKTCEMYALTSFGLNASARNLTTGDAYAMLKVNGAPKQLTEFMLSSCVSNGVNASVLDALSSAAAALQQIKGGPGDYDQKEQRRLKRVADASLSTGCISMIKKKKKKQRPLSPIVNMEASRVKTLLSTAGLIKGDEAVLHYKEMSLENSFAKVVDVVASCVSPSANDQARAHAVQAARNASVRGVLKAISAATCVLRAFPGAKITPAFVVRHDLVGANEDQIKFGRVLPCGGLEECSPGTIIDTPHAVVLLVRIGKSVRVTGTLRA